MKIFRLEKIGSIDGLELRDEPIPQPGPGEVLVNIKATSLNFRDLSIVQGRSQQVESIAYSATGIYTIVLSNIWVGHLSINPTLQYATLNAGVRFVSFTPSTRTLVLNTITLSTGAALGLSATSDARINVHMDVTDAI